MADVINSNQVSVGTTATQIVPANGNRRRIIIFNNSAVTVDLGSSTETAATGGGLPSGLNIPLTSRCAIYGIVGTGTAAVSYIEESQA